ncbi:MAG: relaxase domain-containing protein [Acidimicrobiales bacterium]
MRPDRRPHSQTTNCKLPDLESPSRSGTCGRVRPDLQPPESISTAWATAPVSMAKKTREVVYDCHRRAVEYAISYAEIEAFKSRSGTNGIVDEDLIGVATPLIHARTPAPRPQMHDQVGVWNRAKSTSDQSGGWQPLPWQDRRPKTGRPCLQQAC